MHPPSTEELKTFYGELSSCSKKPIVLSLSLDHNQSFVHASNHLPTPLQSLYDPDNLDLGYEELLSKSEQFGEDVTSKMCCRLEELTRGQSSSRKWFRYRNGRITASRFHAVLHTNLQKPSQSLLKSICYAEMNANSFRSAACEWGCSHKKDALEAYELSMKDLHTHFKVECCGFFVSQMQHYLGGTPDSVVSCDCHGQGVVEVKCPYCARDSSVSIQAKENRRFCLETVEMDQSD